MLNAIVHPMKEDIGSFVFLYFYFVMFVLFCSLARGLASCKLGCVIEAEMCYIEAGN